MAMDDDDIIGSRRERIGRERRRYSQRDTYIFPRYSRVTSRDYRLHTGSWLVLLAILGCLAGLGYWVYNYQFATETTVQLTVNRLDDQASGSNTHTYLIFATRADGQPEVFRDGDSFWHWKWDSSDVFAALQPGHRYDCDVYGRRHHLNTQYRNVSAASRCKPGTEDLTVMAATDRNTRTAMGRGRFSCGFCEPAEGPPDGRCHDDGGHCGHLARLRPAHPGNPGALDLRLLGGRTRAERERTSFLCRVSRGAPAPGTAR
jgi:hypothetical protein